MNKEKIAELLKVSVEELDNNSKKYEDLDATYYWNPIRGGNSLIISSDGSYLICPSSLGPNAVLEEFKKGKRNGSTNIIDNFIIKEMNSSDPFWGNKVKEFFNNLTNISKEEQEKLIDKFINNKSLYNEFTKELLSSNNYNELFNKYINK